MHRVLIRIGNFELMSYSVMLLIAFITALYVSEYRAQKKGIKKGTVSDIAFWVIIGTVLGARIAYVIFHWSYYSQNIAEIIKIWHGGAMYYGGFILAFILGYIYVKVKKLNLLLLLDAVGPTIALGEGFGRIGCFLNGCCFGIPSNTCGITFPLGSPAGEQFPNTPVIPTQLLLSIGGFIVFFMLLIIEKKHKFKKGQIFALSLFFFTLLRFIVNFIRFYEDLQNYLFNQIVVLVGMIIGLVLYIVWGRRKTAT